MADYQEQAAYHAQVAQLAQVAKVAQGAQEQCRGAGEQADGGAFFHQLLYVAPASGKLR